MTEKYLHRGDAPFGESIWTMVDGAVVEAARGQLCARRLLHIEGPYGLGLKSMSAREEGDEPADEKGVTLRSSGAAPIAMISAPFTLPVRDIASFELTGLPYDLGPAAMAAIACAKQEDDLVFYGSKALGALGLLNAKGTQSLKLKSWEKVGTAADDIIEAVTKLDDAGLHGPYTLALAPRLFNLLFRRYAQGNQTEMEHVRAIVTDGVVKAPGVKEGGVLLATGRHFASIVVGQDLAAAFVGPTGTDYEFVVAESLALRLAVPQSVCVLKA